ncbi:Adenylate isopentenyltransferase 5 [Arabidopsis thaliana]|uniref:adenylate dimethylallyltransferase (ADP/ATP-dependent) n=2 Tax=Arabidopsis TaxID=3701 RepID=A0A178UCV3_ARATH|nr:IPP transferase [Arabidopsis thaliana x Arabidopsis arenosa]OAO90521.1 IPT5 [Arabidopsis thaliana]
MKPCMTALRQVIQPLSLNFQGNMVDVPFFRRKDKVVFVMGATGTGKSRLAIDLATRFPAEIVNSDKIQVYKGLDIVTNKVTPEESLGVPHHLLGTVHDTCEDFTAEDFQREAIRAVESIVQRDRVPIIAGGSNSYIEALVNDCVDFRLRYNCCFLWVDVSRPVLHSFVSERVDKMVEMGLVDEVRRIFDPSSSDYSAGIRRAIGVPELDEFLRSEMRNYPAETTERLLETAIEKIKENTCLLACRQLQKIQRLYKQWKWNMHRVDATEVFLRRGEEADEAWDNSVAHPSALAVEKFLSYSDDHHLEGANILLPEISAVPPLPAAVAAISR